MATSDLGLIASAFAEGAKIWNNYLVSRDKERARECKKCAREFFQLHYKEDTYKDWDDKKREKYMAHYRKRFEHFD